MIVDLLMSANTMPRNVPYLIGLSQHPKSSNLRLFHSAISLHLVFFFFALDSSISSNMGVQKKSRKFAQAKRAISLRDNRL